MLARSCAPAAVVLLMAVLTVGCSPSETQEGDDGAEMTPEPAGAAEVVPGIDATNAFYSYADLEGAWTFYSQVMGFETVADYGFAKILRVAPASYLTLVDQAEAMHATSAPRSVTLGIVTEEVEGWWAYLSSRGVPTTGDYEPGAEAPHEGFVVVDPEGYHLEIERYNRHPENDRLRPVLEAVEPMGPAGGDRPEALTVRATVLRLYYDELEPAGRFWERLLGADVLLDRGWARVYGVSDTGFLALVDGARGLHEATEEQAVTVSFLTRKIGAWLRRAREQGVQLQTPGITEERRRVRTFVARDPGGYFLEWDTFLPVADNERLLELLAGG